MDLLFVPMGRREFLLFQSGRKTFEVRRRGRQWTKQFVTQGRKVEIRLGYGKTYKALWGTISLVYEVGSVDELFETVPFKQVMPVAGNLEIAKEFALWEFFGTGGLDTSFKLDLIAFEVILNK